MSRSVLSKAMAKMPSDIATVTFSELTPISTFMFMTARIMKRF